MEAKVKWVDGFKFLGESNSGHSIVMDGNGGATAPSPMEMVLMGAGGCSSVDVVDGLKKANQKVMGCVAKLSAERREKAPRLFTTINIHFVVSGEEIREGGRDGRRERSVKGGRREVGREEGGGGDMRGRGRKKQR